MGEDPNNCMLIQTMFEGMFNILRLWKEQMGKSEEARRLAVTITELEKAHAYFSTYVEGPISDGGVVR